MLSGCISFRHEAFPWTLVYLGSYKFWWRQNWHQCSINALILILKVLLILPIALNVPRFDSSWAFDRKKLHLFQEYFSPSANSGIGVVANILKYIVSFAALN